MESFADRFYTNHNLSQYSQLALALYEYFVEFMLKNYTVASLRNLWKFSSLAHKMLQIQRFKDVP